MHDALARSLPHPPVSSVQGSRKAKRPTSLGDGAGRGQGLSEPVGDIRFRGHSRREALGWSAWQLSVSHFASHTP